MKKIDLSDIKENDLDKTSSFTDLMSKKQLKKRHDDIEDMIEEKRKNTKDLKSDLDKAKKEYNNIVENDLEKTKSLEITRQMKFNMNEIKENNHKKKGISKINITGEISILCIIYYLYLLLFTNYQDSEFNYLITGSIIVLMVLLFGLSIVTNKKASNVFNILNIMSIIGFIGFNIYIFI